MPHLIILDMISTLITAADYQVDMGIWTGSSGLPAASMMYMEKLFHHMGMSGNI